MRAVADPARVRLLLALRGGECCVCQLVALLELAPSTVSKHLAILQSSGLVTRRKSGRWAHYRLAESLGEMARRALAAVEAAAESEEARRDAARLSELRGADLEALCRIQYRA